MLQIQAKITDILEAGGLASLISLDLSAAFDVINHELLLKRMAESGVPKDIISLIKPWLEMREAFVEIEGETSYFFKVTTGTIQGSVLGPVLFAIYVRGLLDIQPVTIYADDNYLVSEGTNMIELKHNTEINTRKLVNYLTSSGLTVNILKTELLVFGGKAEVLEITLNSTQIKSKPTMKVLGVTFDNKLDWSSHINDVITKVTKVQFGIRCIKKYFTLNELLDLVTSLGLSKLYYGAPVWLSRSLHSANQKKLLRASAGLIKSCIENQDWNLVSFSDLHQLSGKATPMMMSDYFQAMTLKNIVKHSTPDLVWAKLQMNYRLNRRTGAITFGNGSTNLYGRNNFGNRVQHVSNKLPAGWENMSISSFKKSVKDLFFKFD